jgi:hypothetical protein
MRQRLRTCWSCQSRTCACQWLATSVPAVHTRPTAGHRCASPAHCPTIKAIPTKLGVPPTSVSKSILRPTLKAVRAAFFDTRHQNLGATLHERILARPSPSLTTTVDTIDGPRGRLREQLENSSRIRTARCSTSFRTESSTTAARGAIRRLCSKLKAVARQWDIRVRTRNQLIMCLLIQRLV